LRVQAIERARLKLPTCWAQDRVSGGVQAMLFAAPSRIFDGKWEASAVSDRHRQWLKKRLGVLLFEKTGFWV
jgi:hypothetical protein